MYTIEMYIPGKGLYVNNQGPFDPEEYYRERYINEYLVPALKRVVPDMGSTHTESIPIPEVSKWLGYSEQTIRNKMSQGEFVEGIHYVKLGKGKGGKVRFIRSALEQMIADKMIVPDEIEQRPEKVSNTAPTVSNHAREAASNKDFVNI